MRGCYYYEGMLLLGCVIIMRVCYYEGVVLLGCVIMRVCHSCVLFVDTRVGSGSGKG